MKILIDIGHPAHVHYFRNFIKVMENKGHKFLITARHKEVSQSLLNEYNIAFKSRGKGLNNILGKFFYTIYADTLIIRYALKFKPDILLSFASPYTAHASRFLKRPCITLTDTEHAKLGNLGFVPFSTYVLTPDCFESDLEENHLRFTSFMELSYLHPHYYIPTSATLKKLNLNGNDKFVLLRFVSWKASHDIGYSGFSDKSKLKLVKVLSSNYRVLISSEDILPRELQKYKLEIEPSEIHNVMNFSSLVITEGATIASECAMLGTPVIYINPLSAGTLKEQFNRGLLNVLIELDQILKKAEEILNDTNIKKELQKRRQKMLSDKIDVTAFMVWFIENYPESVKVMQENPDYQYRFK